MAKPVLVVVDDEDESRRVLADELGSRYGAHYEIVSAGSPEAALARLGELRAAGVYGASEGLSTVLLEREAFGGQAGTSSRIRNYLGFPRGVSGVELAWRAYEQAWVFGAHFVYGNPAISLAAEGDLRVVGLQDGSRVRARGVIIATGVSYRRLGIPELEALAGAGVFYGAGTVEAQAVTGKPVFVVGGGNSAGQAALHLAKYARQVTILVRARSLAASMADYLIREIENAPNIDVRYRTEVVSGGGDGHLEHLLLRHRWVVSSAPRLRDRDRPARPCLPADLFRGELAHSLATGGAQNDPICTAHVLLRIGPTPAQIGGYRVSGDSRAVTVGNGTLVPRQASQESGEPIPAGRSRHGDRRRVLVNITRGSGSGPSGCSASRFG